METTIKVLLIEDSKIDQMAFKRLVKQKSLAYDYAIAGCVTEAKQVLDTGTFDIIISDHQLGDGTAFDIFNLNLETPVIITTGTGSESVAVQAMKAGAYDYLIKDDNGHYLEVLPLVIAKAIKHRQAEAQSQLLSHALEQIRDSVYVTNAQDLVIFVNQAFCETYGYQPKEILDKPAHVLLCKDLDTPDATDLISTKLSTHVEIYQQRRDGSIFPASVSRSIMQHDGQKVNVFITHDITARKQAEAEIKQLNESLKQRTAELEIAKKELEAFSYSVSHDLRNPLSGLKGLTWLLLNKCSGQLDPKAQKYLQQMEGITKRMEELIKDLLTLSQITRTEINTEKVNLSAIAQIIAQNLQQTQPERQVEFAIAPDICVQGDPGLLKIALENLLSNAWKYTSKRSQALIEFAAMSHGQIIPDSYTQASYASCPLSNVYFIRDNGAGFDMAYASQLFGAFQRLHSLSEFDGTGVGLATVQRIIHRHGGKIWAQAAVEQGATFYFTL